MFPKQNLYHEPDLYGCFFSAASFPKNITSSIRQFRKLITIFTNFFSFYPCNQGMIKAHDSISYISSKFIHFFFFTTSLIQVQRTKFLQGKA